MGRDPVMLTELENFSQPPFGLEHDFPAGIFE